jgi:hypothetical protein
VATKPRRVRRVPAAGWAGRAARVWPVPRRRKRSRCETRGPGRRPAAHRPGARRPSRIHRAEPSVRRPGRADGTGNDRPGPGTRRWYGPTPPTTRTSSPRPSTYSRQPDHDADLQPPALCPSTGACGRTQSARSATGRTTTWTSATPAQSATHAAASSPQAKLLALFDRAAARDFAARM